MLRKPRWRDQFPGSTKAHHATYLKPQKKNLVHNFPMHPNILHMYYYSQIVMKGTHWCLFSNKSYPKHLLLFCFDSPKTGKPFVNKTNHYQLSIFVGPQKTHLSANSSLCRHQCLSELTGRCTKVSSGTENVCSHRTRSNQLTTEPLLANMFTLKSFAFLLCALATGKISNYML